MTGSRGCYRRGGPLSSISITRCAGNHFVKLSQSNDERATHKNRSLHASRRAASTLQEVRNVCTGKPFVADFGGARAISPKPKKPLAMYPASLTRCSAKRRPSWHWCPGGSLSKPNFHFKQASPSQEEFCQLDSALDRNLFQTKPWIDFIAQTQNARPISLLLFDGDKRIGWFTGLIIRKGPFKILGSPFPGWTTPHIGFNVSPGVDLAAAIQALKTYAFECLKCVHLEIVDCQLDFASVHEAALHCEVSQGYELDLWKSEEELLASMHHSPRRYIRKAWREGYVTVEESGPEGFAQDYFAQLKDVYARSSLVPTYDLNRVRVLVDCLFPTGKLLLLRARDRMGRSVATGIFPASHGVMYLWGAADRREFQRLHVNEPLQWHAIRYWKHKGVTRYHMGGGENYKEKYGARLTKTPWIVESKFRLIRYLRSCALLGHALGLQLRGLTARPQTFNDPRLSA